MKMILTLYYGFKVLFPTGKRELPGRSGNERGSRAKSTGPNFPRTRPSMVRLTNLRKRTKWRKNADSSSGTRKANLSGVPPVLWGKGLHRVGELPTVSREVRRNLRRERRHTATTGGVNSLVSLVNLVKKTNSPFGARILPMKEVNSSFAFSRMKNSMGRTSRTFLSGSLRCISSTALSTCGKHRSEKARICQRLEKLSNDNKTTPDLKNKGIIHIIAEKDCLKLRYELIKSKPGNMTPRVSQETLDSLNLEWFEGVRKKLLRGQFQFSSRRRIFIPKPGQKEKRPLTVASRREKLVQKSRQLRLEQVFEPSFLPYSHGFRPGRSCHSALKEIYYNWKGVKWIIEADIAKCFDRIHHQMLLDLVEKRVECRKTRRLLKGALKAGWVEPTGVAEKAVQGTPQGSVLSPLLCNIYLHELDKFMDQLIHKKNSGQIRKPNPEYNKWNRRLERAAEKGDLTKAYESRSHLWKIPRGDPMDPNYIRVRYVRYRDDFLIGIIGPKSLANEVLQEVRSFLKEELFLDLKDQKTGIRHFDETWIRFLGREILGRPKKLFLTRKGRARRRSPPVSWKGKTWKTTIWTKKRVTPRVTLHAPTERIFAKLKTRGMVEKIKGQFYGKAWTKMVNCNHLTILRRYNRIRQGYLEYYYTFARNRRGLRSLLMVLKNSCAKTLRLKYKLKSRKKVYEKFGDGLSVEAVSDGKHPKKTKLVSFVKMKDYKIHPDRKKFHNLNPDFSNRFHYWSGKLTRSNLGRSCSICGATPTEMHHV